MAEKTFSYSHSKIQNYGFSCVSGNGSHERGYFLPKFRYRQRLVFIVIIFCVAPQRKVQWAKVRRLRSPDVGSFKGNDPVFKFSNKRIIFVFPLQCETPYHIVETITFLIQNNDDEDEQ